MSKQKINIIIDYLHTRGKIIHNYLRNNQGQSFVIFLFLALVIAVPLSNWEAIIKIMEGSINAWLETIRIVTNDIGLGDDPDITNDFVGHSVTLITGGIDKFYQFIFDFSDFYNQLFQFNFAVFRETGFILSIIFFVTPIVLAFIIIRSFFLILEIIKSEGSFSYKFDKYLKPSFLFIIVFLLPLPTSGVEIKLLFFSLEIFFLLRVCLILLLVYYQIWLLKEINTIDNKLNLQNFPFTKIITSMLLLLILLTSFENSNLSFLSNLSLSSDVFMKLIFLVIVICISLWVVGTLRDIGLKEFYRLLREDYFKKSFILKILLFLLIVLPFLDALFLQTSLDTLILLIINLPWIFGLLFFNPSQLGGLFLNLVTKIFDDVVEASLFIANKMIPTNPSAEAIVGNLQDSFSATLLLTAIFLVVYLFYTLYYDFVEEKYANKSKMALNYLRFILAIILLLILAILLYVLDPEVFLSTYGYQFDIDTNPWIPILGLVIPTILIFLVCMIVIWIFYQLSVKKRSLRIVMRTVAINGLALFVSIIMITPFIFMVKNSLQNHIQNTQDFVSQGLLPDPFTIRNYAQLFGVVDPNYETLQYRVITWMFNSVVAAGTVTAFLIIFSAMAGYCFAKRDFVGKKVLYATTIAILMVPPYVQVIPLYIELNRLDFVGSLLGVILPFLIQPFSVYLCTEFMRNIPDDYLDAARIDGYSELQIFFKIVLPLSMPVMSVMVIINFIGNWNAFIWPLLLLEQSSNARFLRTMPLGMYSINAELQEQVGVILALATIIIIPIFIILFLMQDYIKKGVTVEGLKG